MTAQLDFSCFQPSYHAARQKLLNCLQTAVPVDLIQDHQSVSHPFPGPDAQTLYLDWLWLGQSRQPRRILVLISGTHGVEGFAGSAIQCHLLPALTTLLQQHDQLGVFIIHALNPWGFAWLRRYDHEGIDLNRNFINFDLPLPENTEYEQIHRNLFTQTAKPLAETLTFWRSRLGQREFETVITRGQYQYRDGLFYGGKAASWSRQQLEQVCNNNALHTAKSIAVIDLHTGLGPYGHGEIINDHVPETPGFDWAQQWYGSDAKSALLGESYSVPKQGLLDYFWHSLIGERGCFVTLEYGTYAMDQLVEVSCEEQRYHNSCGKNLQNRDINNSSVIRQRDFFYPQDESWQQQVLSRADEVIPLAVQGIMK
jgi:hypothetical protein